MVNEGFMMNNDEISKNAIVLTANEPKLRGNNRTATQISVLLYPMREIDEISIMAKVFANTFSNFCSIFGNFPNILTCSSQY